MDACKCGATDHLTARSKKCPLNKKNIAKKKLEEEAKVKASLNSNANVENNARIDDLDNNNFVDERMFGVEELELDNNTEFKNL